MKVEITDIFDTNLADSDSGSKLFLMDKIINHFTPLFYEEIEKKQRQLNDNMSDVKKLKGDVSKTKNSLKLLNTEFEKEQVKNKILKEIKYLNRFDILYGNNKQIVKEIILSIKTQPIEGLKKSLETLRHMVRTKVQKVRT